MRVGIVTTWFERGAAYVSKQYRDCLAREHQVFIYARGGESRAVGDARWDDDSVTWGRPGVVPLESSIDLADFRGWLQRCRIELVIFNEQRWWDPVIECTRTGVVCGAYVDYYTRDTVPLFGCYDFLICNTRRHHSVFEWHPQALYIPWGTDVSIYRPASDHPVNPGAVTFFHSSGMNPVRKGTDFVLQAFDKLDWPALLVIHTQCGLAGIEHLAALTEKLEKDGRLRMHDRTVTAPGLYHLGDVYVYPSRLDGIGLTVAEALACGLPAIVPDEPPMNEFLDSTSGATVPVCRREIRSDGYYWPMCFVTVDDLAQVMQSYVDRLGGLARLKRGARAYAESKLDWAKNSKALSQQLSNVKRIEAEPKAEAIKKALNFERARAKTSMRYWFSYHFPSAVQVARQAYRALSR
jgi:1,2-diacylglycerol 3-alpha-glucosyltransferase